MGSPLDELLAAIDVEGRTGDRRVGHCGREFHPLKSRAFSRRTLSPTTLGAKGGDNQQRRIDI
jgi:hypothetical protein